MRDFDSLPEDLRKWVATAKLPWRARSVQSAYKNALQRTRNPVMALQELDALQDRLIQKDATRVWGNSYPDLHVG